MELVLVETKRTGDMYAFYCRTCDEIFYPHSYWPIRKTFGMHVHADKVKLKLAEQEGTSND